MFHSFQKYSKLQFRIFSGDLNVFLLLLIKTLTSFPTPHILGEIDTRFSFCAAATLALLVSPKSLLAQVQNLFFGTAEVSVVNELGRT